MSKKRPVIGASPDAPEDAQHPAEGVVRLTKLPLLAVGVMLLTALCALVYAVLERHQSSRAPGNSGVMDMTGAQSILDAGKGYKEIIQGYESPEVLLPEAGADTRDQKVATPSPLSKAIAATDFLSPFQSDAQDERKLEIQQLRDALLRDAIVSRTRVELDDSFAQPEFPLALSASLPKTQLPPGVMTNDLLTNRIDTLLGAGKEPAAADPNLRGRKEKYVNEASSYAYSPHLKLAPIAPFEIKVGTVIPAILDTQINSDLPGMIIAHVSRSVRDTRTGTAVLIPAGSKLIGDYDHHIAAGQKRLLVVWRRVQFPDASTLALDNMPGVDARGQSGFQDRIDNHYWRTFGSAFLLSVISAASQSSQGDLQVDAGRDTFTRREQFSAELGRQWGEVSRETIKRNFDIQPSLVIRPGFRFNVLVNKDIILAPYQNTW